MERCSKCTLSGQSRSQRSTNCVAYFCEKKTWNSSPKCKQWLPQYSGIIVTIGNVYFLALSTVNIYLIKTFLFLFLVIFVQFPSYKVKAMKISSVQFSSVSQLCPTLCDPMNRSTPGLPVHHQLLEFTQTHVHRVSDAIQPSHPLSSPSPPAPNPSQYQSLFQWVNSSHEVAKVLEFQL